LNLDPAARMSAIYCGPPEFFVFQRTEGQWNAYSGCFAGRVFEGSAQIILYKRSAVFQLTDRTDTKDTLIMPMFRLDIVASLARQLEFAPVEVRLVQLANAESLIYDLQIDKTYPIDFVIHRITGFHPKSVPSDLLAGLALQHDLGLMIEQVSEAMDLDVRQMTEPILSIDDVTERFNVTSKTIQRWRKKGLVSRRFIFADGKKRVGFLLSSIERFVARNSDAVERGANFSQLTDVERDRILEHARRLATKCRCCVREITRRIARRFDRSPLTVLHTVRRHDQQHPTSAIFQSAPADMPEPRRARVVKQARRGIALKVLAARSGRPRATIYRAVMDDRIERLTRRKVRFHDDPMYHQTDAEQFLADMVRSGEFSGRNDLEVRIPKGLPAYLQELYRTPLLTPAQERSLFLQFNFYKGLFVQTRRRFDPELARTRDLNQLEAHSRKAATVKARIVQANLRLVVSVARKHLQAGIDLMELVSEGNVILMRAAESFDVHKNVRFSTYATLALMKGFARIVPELRSGRRGAHLDERIDVADTRHDDRMEQVARQEEVNRLLSLLKPGEREVIAAHFGLGSGEATTLDQLGKRLGMSKHRVRLIEQRALVKLRQVAAVKV
jgi:RNA polymerase primary sigma factor